MGKNSKTKNSTPEIKSTPEEKIYRLDLMAVINKHWLYLLIIFLIVFVVYLNSLGNGFVSDDKGITQDGPLFLSLKWIFTDPLGFIGRMSLSLQYAISGQNPFFYRFVNIFFHLGNSLLLFLIVYLLARPKVAFFAASLFAVHPIVTDAVTWISGGNYVHGAFFFMLSFLFYILSGRNIKFYWVAVGVFLFGLLYSNRIMTYFPILIVYELAFGNLKKRWPYILPFAALSLLWGGYYFFNVSGRESEVEAGGNIASYVANPLFYFPFSLSWYFELIFFPNRLSFYHSDIEVTAPEMVLRWTVFLIYLGALGVSFFKNKFIFFWLSFFIITLILFLTPFQIAWLVAERYAYLGTAGILVAVGFGLAYLTRYKKAKTAVYIFFALIIVALGIRTIIRNFDWKNEDTLMTATLRTNPENAKVHNHIGIIHGKNKNYVEAMKEFQKAMELDPNLAETYHNMGNAFDEQGRALLETDQAKANEFFNNAIPLYEKALSINPRHWMSYQQLANIYFDRREYQKTIDYIMKILPINPNPALIANMGFVYMQMGEKEKAKEAYQEVLRLDPTNQIAAQALQQIDNPTLTPGSSPQTDNPALPGGQLPPEVLKAIQEQTQKSSVPN